MLWFLCLPSLRCDCSQSEFVQIVPWPKSAEPIQGLHVPKRCSFYLLLLLYMSRCCFTTTKVTRFKMIKGWLPWHCSVNANLGSSCYIRPRLSGSSSSSKYISLQHPYPPRSERKHRLPCHRRGSGEFKRARGIWGPGVHILYLPCQYFNRPTTKIAIYVTLDTLPFKNFKELTQATFICFQLAAYVFCHIGFIYWQHCKI